MRLAAIAIIAVFSTLAAACTYETAQLPPALPTPSQNSTIYARDGRAITTLQAEENRENIALDKMPDGLRDAVIAIEDQRFYEHNGIDLTAMLRAASSNATSGAVGEGGSTITQQYVKNAFLDDEQTVDRKIEEAALALQLERTYSKDLILELYLNTIYFGRGKYGVQAASFEYFNKAAAELSIAESALLAGMIQAPSNVDPFVRPDAAIERRDLVLEQMLETDRIDEATYEAALQEPLSVDPGASTVTIGADQYPAGHFVEEVKQWILNNPLFGETRDERINLLFGGGLKITTTIDLDLQAEAEAVVQEVLPEPGRDPEAAVVTLDPRTGQVLAMVGGRDYWGETDFAKYNLARGKGRQSGSSFKPMVLASALEDGMPIVTGYTGPSSISIPRFQAPAWNVKGGCGRVTLVEATVKSCNTVYAQLIMDVGAPEAIETASRLGIGGELQTNEAAVLGTNDVTPLDMASAFGTFANHGYRIAPTFVRRIVNADGTVLYEDGVETEAVLEPAVADLVTWTLEQVIQRGTGTRAQLPDRPAAGKTGTTENSWDAWFVGYTPQRVTAVWVGFPEGQIAMRPPRTRITVYGGTWPAEIWRGVMERANEGLPVEEFVDPPPEIFAGIGSSEEYLNNKYVPNVQGRTLSQATIDLVKEGYLAQVLWRDDKTLPPDVVLAQWPPPEDVLPVGSNVILEIARAGPEEDDAAGSVPDAASDPDTGPDPVLATLSEYYSLIIAEEDLGTEVAPEDELGVVE